MNILPVGSRLEWGCGKSPTGHRQGERRFSPFDHDELGDGPGVEVRRTTTDLS
jgi:hypothetical protein